MRAIDSRDWDALEGLLHPHLHWTGRAGGRIRGRRNVIAHLLGGGPVGTPSRYELRDGQIYRWVEEDVRE